jgi:large subunit ribosomal protein L15
MQMHQLKRKNPNKKSKLIGRGGARGNFSGRGIKGQKAHGSHGIRPEMRDTIKRIPKIKGRGKNLNVSVKEDYAPVNIATLDKIFEKGTTITPNVLLKENVIKRKKGKLPVVKILGTGETKKNFAVENCKVSVSAKEKIESAGGSVK